MAGAARATAAYSPPATYFGDGATNDGAGGWTTASAQPGQCLTCHGAGGSATDMSAYLKTGHKNMLRKVTPGAPWTYADGTPLSTTDAYGSGSTYDWNAGTVTVGTNPGPYPPDTYAGQTRKIFYIFGGWSDPAQLDTIWDGGFTGEQYASGNYECARCHTTGYAFDGSQPLPGIPDAAFSRFPTDSTSGTSSWNLDGVQCERCHSALPGHTTSGNVALVTKPAAEEATALCLQCHREENVDTNLNTFSFGDCSDGSSLDHDACVAIPGNTWVSDLVVYDGGSCSDGVSPDYFTCVGIPGNTWSYAPFFDHESGPTFLNGPHARFSGTLALTNQNSTDMSLLLTGSFASAFTDPASGENAGCTGCHDPHQSTVPAVGATRPFVKGCLDCHSSYANVLSVVDHPTGAGTPFDTNSDLNAACSVCHMSQSYHLFRISTDSSYATFPSAAQVAAGGGQGVPNSASDGKLVNAVWSDLDLACGQCHGGSGLLGPGAPGIVHFSKDYLGQRARCIHHEPVIHTSAVGGGSISPPGTTLLAPGGSQTLTFTPDPGYDLTGVTVDGQAIPGAPASYGLTGVDDCHTVSARFDPYPVLTASIASGAGSIADSVDANVVTAGSGTVAVPRGSSVTYRFTAAKGYLVSDVRINFTDVGAVSSYTVANVRANQWIRVTFAPIVSGP
jgi:predicted CXXCH cytochrome family protein